MSNYISDNNISNVAETYESLSYLPSKCVRKTEIGVTTDEEAPLLAGDDNIFSEVNITKDVGSSYQKIVQFIADFTYVFAKTKVPDRAYSKFIQNKNELPDVELDWVFQHFNASFLFSASEGDYYSITKYDVNTGKYDSTTGPLNKENYRNVAEEVMEKVQC